MPPGAHRRRPRGAVDVARVRQPLADRVRGRAGVPPRVHVLDEASSQLAHEQRWERFVDGLYTDPKREELLLRAQRLGVAFEPQYQGHATFKDVAVELNGNWDRTHHVGPAAGPAPVLSEVDFSRSTTPSRRSRAAGRVQRSRRPVLSQAGRSPVAGDAGIAGSTIPTASSRLLYDASRSTWGPAPRWRGANWGGDVKAAKACVAAVNDAVEASWVGRPTRCCAGCWCSAARCSTPPRLAGPTAGSSSTTSWCWPRGAAHHADARDALHDRYTHLLLDEFQDTDPIQIDLAC